MVCYGMYIWEVFNPSKGIRERRGRWTGVRAGQVGCRNLHECIAWVGKGHGVGGFCAEHIAADVF